MDIKADFSRAYLDKMLQAKMGEVENTIIQTMQYVGEQFVIDVRSKIQADEGYRELMRAILHRPKVPITEATPRFANDTHALVSSVGFIILKNGKTVFNQFNGTNGEGASAGREVAFDAAKQFPKGLALIVVAGMRYAAAVESLGYDVLTGSSFAAERSLENLLRAIAKG